ncbi:uncharacterized protein [Watersipora subatra]|uniref:uncharacterized protein isoform X2 n=1 Tax=Watersipora subatra TaxID=2589382 RepID=UPI00355BD226
MDGLSLPKYRNQRCSFCCELTQNMVNIMVLPCKHISCKPCMDEYSLVCHDREMKCSQCSRTFTLSQLEEDVADESQADNLKCDEEGCGENPAISYRILCDKKCCISHVQKHELQHAGDVTSIDEHGRLALQKVVFSDIHSGEQLQKACQKRCRLECAECQTSEELCPGTDSKHVFEAITAVAEARTADYRKLVDLLQARVSEICKLMKEAWNKLDEAEELCTRSLNDIEKFKQQEANASLIDIEQAIHEVELYRNEFLPKVAAYDEELTIKQTLFSSLITKLCKVIRGDPMYKVIHWQKLKGDAHQLLAKEPIGCRMRMKRLIYKALPEKTVAFVDVPRSLTLISSHEVKSFCYSACHRKNGDILIGCDRGLWRLKPTEKELTLYDLPMRRVSSIVERNDHVYVLHEHASLCIVDVFEHDMSGRRELFSYANTSGRLSSMTFSGCTDR